MQTYEIEVLVMDGDAVVQRWPCARTVMSDGSEGVVWRGVAYRLLSGDKIDVAEQPPDTAPIRHTVLPGEEASWVLVAGLEGELQRKRRGDDILRFGSFS